MRLAITSQLSRSFRPGLITYTLGTGSSNRRPTYPPVSPYAQRFDAVQEY